jgi:hypothetical protein
MKLDSFMEFREAVEADLDAALDRFINEGRPDFDRIIRSSTPTDWTLGDPDFFCVPDLEQTWSDL